MKNKILQSIVLILLCNVALAQEKITLKFNFVFTNSNPEYIKKTKLVVKVDGVKIAESSVRNQDINNSLEVKINNGYSTITATAYALSNDGWEERTLSNNYSMDCIYKKTQNWLFDNIIDIKFDLKALKVIVDEKTSIKVVNTNNTNPKSYQSELKAVNDYLKTFDNGYYGYLEIIDGYLYDRFKNGGNYCKALINNIDVAVEAEAKRKVSLKCKSDDLCVFSTFTSSNHASFSFSQNSDFNTKTLIDLLNNLIAAYKNIEPNTSNSNSKSNQDKLLQELKYAVDELNKHLPTLDNGRYKGIGVKDDYVYSYYANNNSSKAKIQDIDYVEANKQYNYVKMACKGNSQCIYSSITGNYHDYFNFNVTSSTISKTETLLKNFVNALKNYIGTNKSTSNNTTTTNKNTTEKSEAQKIREQMEKMREEQQTKPTKNTEENWEDYAYLFDEVVSKPNTTLVPKYANALQKLNDYLKIFNPETYGEVEVKEGNVYFNFKYYSVKYKSSISIENLTKNTTILKATSVYNDEVKIVCKEGKELFYSTYQNEYKDHFRFFSNTVKDLSKMQQLVNEFVNALK